MKRILVITLFSISLAASAQQKPRNLRTETGLLRNSLVKYHVHPRAIDDSFSRDLFDKLISDLDPDKIFFTNADLLALEPFRNQLDEEVNGKTTGFLTQLKDRYKTGLRRTEKLINTVFASALKWEVVEVYDPASAWAPSEEALLDRHRQLLKEQVLDRLAELMERDSVAPADFFAQNISHATAHVQAAALRPIKRLINDPDRFENEISDAFLQTMAGVFDPHSGFFSMAQYEDFVAALSAEDYYFGFVLGEDSRGRVIISALTPGGPAWKSGALRSSDVLIAVKWRNEDPIDLQGLNLDDVNEVLSSNPSDELEMTVRSTDGKENRVLLRKERLETEQNIVQSFVLDGPVKAGYIYLPDFYTRWDDEQEGGRCANDVAKEIIRLRKEGIEGVILDLRFNGGGSLFEARALAGIFIDEGPLAMVTTRDKKAVTLKDMNRGTIYDGPLIIMVNGQSASASEVVAASIQDYNRGLIVGSRTYGKATGQNLFPIDGAPNAVSLQKNSAGYVKLTTQKLYRVTGKSAQGVGVVPDIQLPDVFSALGERESENAFALQRDSVLMNPYFKPAPPLKRKELLALSRERVSKDSTFLALEKAVSWLEEIVAREVEPHPLVWEEYVSMAASEGGTDEVPARLDSAERIFKVVYDESKEQRLAVDEYARAMYSRWHDNLVSDPYLQETYNILRDFVSLTKNPK